MNQDPIVMFKCKDFTTEMVGRRNSEGCYVERGDGCIYQYGYYRVEWSVPLIVDPATEGMELVDDTIQPRVGHW